MGSTIRVEITEDGVAILTLNRPQALNAIDRAMTAQLREAIRRIEDDPKIEVSIIAGAGDRAFCVGVDLKERKTLGDDEARAFRANELFPMYRELDARRKPSIAAVRGHCLGGGFELALSCDLIMATPESTFALPEVTWGLIPAGGGCRKLPKLIGPARAKEIILAGKRLSAEEAAGLGIINRTVAASELMPAALELARRIMGHVPVAVRGAKECIDHAMAADGGADFDIAVSDRCYADAARAAGIARFKKD